MEKKKIAEGIWEIDQSQKPGMNVPARILSSDRLIDQVENGALAVTQRRRFDVAEALRFEEAVEKMWAGLPDNYKWLKQEWEWV